MADHTSAHSLAIFELVVYIAIAPIELYVLIRHGFRNLLSWITLNSVVMLQLIGAAIVLSQGSTNTSSTGTILAQVGLTPLILSVQAILHQMTRHTSLSNILPFKRQGAVAFHTPIVVAAVMIGVGASKLYTGDSSGGALAKAGMIIIAVCWAYLVGLMGFVISRRHEVTSFRPLLYTAAFAIPMIAIRIVFSFLSIFVTSVNTFSAVNGNIAVRVIMQVLSVMIAVIGLVVGGFMTIRAARDQNLMSSRSSGQPKTSNTLRMRSEMA